MKTDQPLLVSVTIGPRLRSIVTVSIFTLTLALAAGCGLREQQPFVPKETDEKANPTLLSEMLPGNYVQTWQLDNGQIVNFAITVPEIYSEEGEVPLVLALHYGARQYTQFFANRMVHQLIKPAMTDLDAIIVAPDVINGSWDNQQCEAAVMALMRKIVELYSVDQERILVMGYSMGARGAWHLAANYPEFFTACIPISGHPPPDMPKDSWNVPTLALHSQDDEIFPFATIDQAVNAFKAAGNDNVHLWTLEDVSHYSTGRLVEPLREAVTWVVKVWDEHEDGLKNP